MRFRLINPSISMVIVADKLEFLMSNSMIEFVSCNRSKMLQPKWSPKLFTDTFSFCRDLQSFNILHNIIPTEESKEQALKLIL